MLTVLVIALNIKCRTGDTIPVYVEKSCLEEKLPQRMLRVKIGDSLSSGHLVIRYIESSGNWQRQCFIPPESKQTIDCLLF